MCVCVSHEAESFNTVFVCVFLCVTVSVCRETSCILRGEGGIGERERERERERVGENGRDTVKVETFLYSPIICQSQHWGMTEH